MQGEIAEDVKRDPTLTLVDTRHASMFWIEFPEQWDRNPRGPISASVWPPITPSIDRPSMKHRASGSVRRPG